MDAWRGDGRPWRMRTSSSEGPAEAPRFWSIRESFEVVSWCSRFSIESDCCSEASSASRRLRRRRRSSTSSSRGDAGAVAVDEVEEEEDSREGCCIIDEQD